MRNLTDSIFERQTQKTSGNNVITSRLIISRTEIFCIYQVNSIKIAFIFTVCIYLLIKKYTNANNTQASQK